MVKVAEWQQTYYASDSGIQSGATTVRDDESSTEYSSSRKYTGSTTTSTNIPAPTATATGGGDTAAGGLESPTGEAFYQKSLFLVILCFGFSSLFHFICSSFCLHTLMFCFSHCVFVVSFFSSPCSSSDVLSSLLYAPVLLFPLYL